MGLLFVGLISLASLGFAQQVNAAPNVENVTISPAKETIDLTAGSPYSGKITVINDSGTGSTTVTVYSRPYSVTDELYNTQFEQPTENSDLYQWVQFSKTEYTVEPGKSVVVPYTVNVPSNARPGGHYGVIFVETEPHGASDSNGVLRKQRVGSLLYAHVAGKTIERGSLLNTEATFWQQTVPLTVLSRVQNTGNIDFQAGVTLTVKDLFGSQKYKDTTSHIVFPGTTRKIASAWRSTPWFGLFQTEQSITILGKTSSSSHLVLIAPAWLLLALIIVIVAVAGYVLLKNYKKN